MLLSYILKLRWILVISAVYVMALAFNAIGIGVWLPGCLITEFTGYHCLGCGMNRAAIALLQGDAYAAYKLNPLIYLYLAIATIWLSIDLKKHIIHHKLNNTV